MTSGPEVSLQLTGTEDPPRPCILLGIERGKLHVRADRWIEPASRVTVAFARVAISGEVLYCTRKETWYRTSIATISENEEGRREPRLAVSLSGQVITFSDHGSVSADGMIHELSVSGMRLEISHPTAAGTMIFVETESALVVGEVRHCYDRQNGRFEAGVEITDILPDIRLQPSSPGIINKIRRKLAQTIFGASIKTGRTLT